MNIIHTTACITLLTLTAPLHAEELVIEIEATNSGRVYADTTFQDCCDLDSFQANETNIPVENCSTQGGYCMSGKKIASWMFPMPELEPGSTVLSATFVGRHSGGSTSFTLRGKWSNGAYGYNAALSGWSSPNFTGNVGSSGGNFSFSLPIAPDGGAWNDDYLLLSAYRSTYMNFYNSGTLRPKIRMVINIPDASCLGDMNDDGEVNITDLLGVISEWGNPYDVSDLLLVIEQWGSACEQPGACCLPTGGCESTDESGCEDAGGVWNGTGTFCSIVDCPDYGACCWDDESCTLELSDACKTGGGSFRGADTDCSTTDCTIPKYNDECASAMPAINGSNAFSTLDATASSDSYSDALCSGTYLGMMHADIWFSYQATCTGSLTVSTCSTATFDTDLVVYRGTCGDMTQIACNGDNSTCSGYSSYLQTPVTAGEQYLIRIGGWDENSTGTGTLQISCD
ncbi:MAG: hypothetical protein VX727_01615 [Planctomycetota bacterium]|nr:hypothetical protein [Planctomycetota bacterium]